MNKKMLLLLPIILGIGFAYHTQEVEASSLPTEELAAQNEDELFETTGFSRKSVIVEPPPLPIPENYKFDRKDTHEGKELSWDYQGKSDFKVKGVVDVKDPKKRFGYRSSAEEPLGKAEVRFSNGNVDIYTKSEIDEDGKASASFGISGKFP